VDAHLAPAYRKPVRATGDRTAVECHYAGARCRRSLPASLGAIFSAQVIEHLQYEELLQFLHLARRKLMPGGVLIAETVNPHSYRAMKTFWVDLTHQKPIFPEVLAALCQLEGFSSARVVFPLGTGQLEADRRTEGEYAIVAVTEPRLNRDEDPTHDLPGVAR